MSISASQSKLALSRLSALGEPHGDVDALFRVARFGIHRGRNSHHPELSQPRVAITPRPDPKLIAAVLRSAGEMRAVMLSKRVWAISQVPAAPSRRFETKDNAKYSDQHKRNKNQKFQAYATEGCTHCKPLRTITEQKCTLIGGIRKDIHTNNLGCTLHSLQDSNACRISLGLSNPLQYPTSRCRVYKISTADAPTSYIERCLVKIESKQLDGTWCGNAISSVSTRTFSDLRDCGGRS
jgi:hypothetical protein